jgi:dCMP deaminase
MALKKDFSKIASFGYNGSYSGALVNKDTGTEEDSLAPGESGFIHAEVNMIAKFQEYDPQNYIILLTLSPCKMCTKILINAGFKHVYWIQDYRDTDHLKIFDQCNITSGKISNLVNDYYTIKG